MGGAALFVTFCTFTNFKLFAVCLNSHSVHLPFLVCTLRVSLWVTPTSWMQPDTGKIKGYNAIRIPDYRTQLLHWWSFISAMWSETGRTHAHLQFIWAQPLMLAVTNAIIYVRVLVKTKLIHFVWHPTINSSISLQLHLSLDWRNGLHPVPWAWGIQMQHGFGSVPNPGRSILCMCCLSEKNPSTQE